jgi:hypothetical protein
MNSSSAIQGCSRLQALEKLATRITSIATLVVPDNSNKGVHLRFINRSDTYDNLKTSDLAKIKFETAGSTPLGACLEKNVLRPLVYDVIANNKPIPHPLLILTITDGCPDSGDGDKFRNEIARCGKYLVDNGYPKAGLASFRQGDFWHLSTKFSCSCQLRSQPSWKRR